LSRAIGQHWSFLSPRVRKLEERKDVGQALTAKQEQALIQAADENRSPNLRTMVRVALSTDMRAGELCALTWGQVDLVQRIITIGKAKTAAGTGRPIPMNSDLLECIKSHAKWFTKRFGETHPQFYLFPRGSPFPIDPNVTFARSLAGNFGFRASYAFSRATQLTRARDINQPLLSTTPFSQDRRPYPQWQTLTFAEMGATSVFHALQFVLSHRWASGLWLQTSYQYRFDRSDVPTDIWSLEESAPGVTYGYDRH
jgi:hypothetical protein